MFDNFFNQFNGRFVDLSASAKSRLVMSTVFSSIGYFKVLNPIIRVIVVYMVYNFARFKLATNMFFYNLSIAFALPSRVIFYIALYKISVALSATKYILAFFMALVVSKCCITITTLKYAYPRFIVASPSTVSSVLRWWGSKIRLTKFTNIFHINYYSIQCMELQ